MSGESRPGKVVVLDDDPTGTQTTHDIDMVLADIDAGLRRFAASDDRGVYVLTNTRAMTPAEVTELLGGLSRSIHDTVGPDALVVLRGDSTLRGHIALEMNLLGLADAVGVIVPAFPAGGRTTRDGVHFVRTAEGELPAAETEYAKDPVFGYSHSRLTDWAREAGLTGDRTPLPLAELRERGAEAVTAALRAARPGSVLLPDVETDDDIALIAEGITAARESGRRVVVRSAATLAATLAGTSAKQVVPPRAQAVLVACGSHTDGATRQLERLGAPVRSLPDAERLLDESDDAAAELDALAAALRAELAETGLAVVASPRKRSAGHGGLEHGAAIMSALVRVVRATAPAADVVVTKGGITGADIATRALDADVAHVLGQVVTGVPLWRLSRTGTGAGYQVVVPGNVGSDDVLRDIVDMVRGTA
ncbi:four-carbon acid sugar kinase family protein [Prauserella cavernicola]|uniref:Four-carbon acid sugar kinase family protein n=1 Tax=Prauserella cavernicola TaxID=2800127 RepID=A0A934QLU2_9PSEU|nr:four-carbon acid sugar kinase family protein [Prauserella cavernicola]MBK1783607.1 hypothetical protein [Prauserella cavernicola]